MLVGYRSRSQSALYFVYRLYSETCSCPVHNFVMHAGIILADKHDHMGHFVKKHEKILGLTNSPLYHYIIKKVHTFKKMGPFFEKLWAFLHRVISVHGGI